MTNQKPYTVVVGVDYSATGDLAFERAIKLCQAEPLSLLHVIHVAHMSAGVGDVDHPVSFDPAKHKAEVGARLKSYVEKRVDPLRASGRPVPDQIFCHVRWKSPGEEIAQLASDADADVVVVGTHGRRGVQRILLGSVAEIVVRLAPCAVVVERPKSSANVPAIQPPCSECLKTRETSGGTKFWCAQHSEHHGQSHSLYGSDRVSGQSTLPNVGW